MTVKAFAELMDMPLRSLHNYLSGEREPSIDLLIKINKILSININWLITGNGEMLQQPSDFTEQEITLIKQYREMPDNVKIAINTTFHAVFEKFL